MKRRQLIKNLGLGGVALVATPTVLSILQSCKSEPVFETVFLNQLQGRAMRYIVDLIIPSDDAIPGAIDVGVHTFIDTYWNDVLEEEHKPEIQLGFDALGDRLENMTGNTFINAGSEDFDQLLAKYLMATPEQEAAYQKNLGSFYQTYAKDKTTIPDPDAASFSLLGNLREMTLWAWRMSEEIGEKVLAYDPIPGQQIGCLPVQEATGGKAYSL